VIDQLKSAVEMGDTGLVADLIADAPYYGSDLIPDEVSFEILNLTKNESLLSSNIPAHLLNFFEFESARISRRAKERCKAFLREWGDSFTHFHSQQVVAELREGKYLE